MMLDVYLIPIENQVSGSKVKANGHAHIVQQITRKCFTQEASNLVGG